MELYQIYRPITATPFKNNESYTEVEPCNALKPYIRCFWGTAFPQYTSPDSMRKTALFYSDRLKISALSHSDRMRIPALSQSGGLSIQPSNEKVLSNLSDSDNSGPGTGAYDIITPDTCADIIFHVDFTAGTVESAFCGINDSSFQSDIVTKPDRKTAEFAIRFYAWSAIVFAEDGMQDSRNIHCDAGYYFSGLKKALEDKMRCFENLSSMAAEAEKYLLNHIHRERLSSTVTEAIGILLTKKGNIRTRELAGQLHISSRQLERIFRDHIGITPKKLSSLVRYQYLWQDIVYQRQFNILDAVHQYGYADQAHLSRDFKSFHTMTIPQARLLAQSDR